MTHVTFEQVNQDHLRKLVDLAPEVGTNLGLSDHDDRWPEGTEASRRAILGLLQDWQAALKALPEAELTGEELLDVRIFGDHLRLVEWAHVEIASRRHDPDVFSPLSWTLLRQVRATSVPDEQRYLSLAARLRTVGEYLERARDVVTEPDATWTEIAQAVAAEAPALFAAIRDSAQEASIPQALKEELALAAQAAGSAVASHQQWLRELRPVEGARWVLGTERFTELLKLRGLPTDLGALVEMGRRYIRESEAERRRAARRIVEGGDVEEALKKIRADAPTEFEQGLARVRAAVQASRTFVVERGLCPLPEDEALEVIETPAPLRPLIPFAALLPPPRLGAQHSVYVVSPPADGGPLTDLCMADVENTAIHEGYPGHHLQQGFANKHTGLLRDGVPLGYFADLAAMWATETVEGWAHYCEVMMREEGFQAGPVARLQIAQDALWRAHRVVIDVGLSTGELSVDAAITQLVEGVGMSHAQATAEVRRYTRSPGYQLCYLLGKHELFELRHTAKVAWRGDYSARRFHEFVLGMGNVPLRYLAEALRSTEK